MDTTCLFFIAFAIVIGIVGLVAAAWADDYMRVFGLGLVAFGAGFAFDCVKRHHDERDRPRRIA